MGSSLFKPVNTSLRFGLTVSDRVFLCVCGFDPPSIASQIRHRKVCPEWRNRPDPRGLLIARGQAARRQRDVREDREREREREEREFVDKAEIPPSLFSALQVALKARYPKGWVDR